MSLTLTRPRTAAAALAAAALAVSLGAPQNASAGDAPGNNGTLKVHAPGTTFEDRSNEPQPVEFCAFYLAGYNFDSNQVITYVFTVAGGPNGGEPAGTPGSFTVGPANGRPAGDGRTPLLTKDEHNLRDGLYRVTGTTTDGSKSKTFRVNLEVNCPGGSNPAPPVGGVGGVGQPDEDDGPGGVGGSDTGGGGPSGGLAAL